LTPRQQNVGNFVAKNTKFLKFLNLNPAHHAYANVGPMTISKIWYFWHRNYQHFAGVVSKIKFSQFSGSYNSIGLLVYVIGWPKSKRSEIRI